MAWRRQSELTSFPSLVTRASPPLKTLKLTTQILLCLCQTSCKCKIDENNLLLLVVQDMKTLYLSLLCLHLVWRMFSPISIVFLNSYKAIVNHLNGIMGLLTTLLACLGRQTLGQGKRRSVGAIVTWMDCQGKNLCKLKRGKHF